MWKCYAEDLALGKSQQENKTFLLAQQFRNMTYGSGREYTPYHVIPTAVVSLKYDDERAALPVSVTSGSYGHPHMLRRKERNTKEKLNRLIMLGTKASIPGFDLSLPGAVHIIRHHLIPSSSFT